MGLRQRGTAYAAAPVAHHSDSRLPVLDPRSRFMRNWRAAALPCRARRRITNPPLSLLPPSSSSSTACESHLPPHRRDIVVLVIIFYTAFITPFEARAPRQLPFSSPSPSAAPPRKPPSYSSSPSFL